MIKFFRKIRQNLLSKGNTGRYLKYAIGEIILVVIGILIALQINNWNEGQKIKEKEVVFLKEIISDLEVNEQRANTILNDRFGIGQDSILKIYAYIIYHLEQKSPYDSTLNRHFYIAHQLTGFSYKQSGYESLMSSGMDIIQNDSIRSVIGEYYTVVIPRSKSMHNELRDDFYNYLLKFPRTLFITKKDDFGNSFQIPLDYDKLIENTEYIESLKMFAGIYEMNLIIQKRYLDRTKNLKLKLELYLS